MQKDFPYLTCEHFPADWVITEMVKLYLHGQHRTMNKKCKADKDSDLESSLDDEDEDESGEESTKKHCCVAAEAEEEYP